MAGNIPSGTPAREAICCPQIPAAILFLAVLGIAGVYAADGVSLTDETGDLGVQAHLSAAEFRVQHIGCTQPERVHAGVGNTDGTDQFLVHAGFPSAGQVRVNDFGVDAGAKTAFHESFLVREVVFRQGDEQSARIVNAVRGDAFEDFVLLDTLPGRFFIAYGVTGTRVEQAVVSARGTGGNVRPLDQQRP